MSILLRTSAVEKLNSSDVPDMTENAQPENPAEKPDGEQAQKQVHPLERRTINSDQILAGDKEVWISHGGMIYRLCETKSGKLILQK